MGFVGDHDDDRLYFQSDTASSLDVIVSAVDAIDAAGKMGYVGNEPCKFQSFTQKRRYW